jgi:hypothetical protein
MSTYHLYVSKISQQILLILLAFLWAAKYNMEYKLLAFLLKIVSRLFPFLRYTIFFGKLTHYVMVIVLKKCSMEIMRNQGEN